MARRLLLTVLVLLCSVSASVAANRYVRQGAAGTGTGLDWTNACTDFTGSCAPASLVRGDTYYVADGTYATRDFNTTVSGTTLITIRKATIADHGTDTGWSDTFGDGQAAWTGAIRFNSSNWLFDGVTGGGVVNNWINNFGFKVTEVNDNIAIFRTGLVSGTTVVTANNITVRHVHLVGKGSVSNAGGFFSNDCVGIYGGSNITLSYFRTEECGRCPFFVSPAGSGVLIEHGLIGQFYGADPAPHSETASIWAFAGAVADITFRWNLIEKIYLTGGLMWDNSSNPSAHMYIYGNVFYKPAGADWSNSNGMIGGWTGNGGEEFHNAWVYNNSIVTVDESTLSTFPNIFSGNQALNNLWYNSDSPSFAKFPTHNYNHFINSGGTHAEANGTSGTTNPFVNFTARDFRLAAATTAGTTLAAPYNIDMYGNTRGADGTWDRGAIEFGLAIGEPPVVTITAPNGGSDTGVILTPLTTLAGTASDPDGTIASVVVTCTPSCGTPTVSGTTAWSVASLPLQAGANLLTVTVTDNDSNTATDTITVTYTPTTIFTTNAVARVSAGQTGQTITTGAFTVTAGQLLVVTAAANQQVTGTATGWTITDNQAPDLTYTEVGRRSSPEGASRGGVIAWVAPIASTIAGLTVTVTVTGVTNDGVSIKVYPVTNADLTTPVGAQTEGDATTNNLTTTSLTPQSNGLGFAVATDWSVAGVPVSADLTVDAYNDPNTIAGLAGYTPLTAGVGATANLDAGGTAAAEWQYLWFEIREVTQGGPGTGGIVLRLIR